MIRLFVRGSSTIVPELVNTAFKAETMPVPTDPPPDLPELPALAELPELPEEELPELESMDIVEFNFEELTVACFKR